MQKHICKYTYSMIILFIVFGFLMGESDWMRIGAFLFNSQEALLTDKFNLPLKIVKEKTIEKMLEACGSCLLKNIKTGIWIAGKVD